MPLVVNTNVPSFQAQRNLSKSQAALSSSFNKLSSGFRINSAADDASGLAISEGMKSSIRSFVVAERNANDGISMSQTAEGALGEVHDILGRMRELAMQSSNGTLTATDRSYVDAEFQQLKSEVQRIQDSTKFNGKDLIKAVTTAFTFQVGLDNVASDQIAVSFGNVKLTALLAAANKVDGAGATAALTALGTVDAAIGTVSGARSRFGAVMNRLTSAASNITTMRLNLTAANSRVRDVDVADETSRLSKNQVLTQAGVAVLAQANQLPQLAFGLLGGR